MVDLTQIIVAIIGLVSSVIAVLITRSNLTEKGYKVLQTLAHIAVGAMEQIFSEGGMGETKLAEATAFVLAELAKCGLTFSADAVRNAIENEVKKIQPAK